jgi:plastocyanin
MRAAPLLAACALALLLGGAGGQGSSTTTVTLQGDQFHPAEVVVHAGDTVQWVHQDALNVAHTVTAFDGTWGSDALENGDTFTHTFPLPGIAPYHCVFHPAMVGIVVVEP